MPFDPRLIPSDLPPLDERGELQFPADLELLGQQLADDAAHLARSYPARCTTSPPQLASGRELRRPRRALTFGGIAGAALLAASAVLVAVLWPGDSEPRAVVPPPMPSPHAVTETDVPHLRPTVRPVVLRGLSAPEVEGLLDLRDDSAEVASVAF